MVNLRYLSGGEAYLVTVRRISVRGFLTNLSLRKLAGDCLIVRDAGVGGTSDPHCLINIRTARKRIANTTAKTSGGPTERFDFGRVIVCFIFELDEPFLFVISMDNDGCSVNFV